MEGKEDCGAKWPHLVLVDGDTSHIGTRGSHNATQRAANATAHVQHAVHVPNLQ